MADFSELLKAWEQCAVDLKDAVAKRDYQAFQKATRAGDRYFKEIKNIIQAKQTDLKPFSAQVNEIVKVWSEASGTIPAWMNEVKSDIARTKESKLKNTRINNAYRKSGAKNTGINLKLKVK